MGRGYRSIFASFCSTMNGIEGKNKQRARIQKILSEGSKFDKDFLRFFSWWGDTGSKYRYKWAIIDDDGPTLNAGLVALWLFFFKGIRTSIAKQP